MSESHSVKPTIGQTLDGQSLASQRFLETLEKDDPNLCTWMRGLISFILTQSPVVVTTQSYVSLELDANGVFLYYSGPNDHGEFHYKL